MAFFRLFFIKQWYLRILQPYSRLRALMIPYMRKFIWVLLLGNSILFSCKTSSPHNKLQPNADDGKLEVVFLQVNDVYEISPLEGGKVGGLSRVATIKNRLLVQNANTRCIIAGDFLNPSVLGTLKYEGQRIAGRQMVDVMNTMGMDAAIFGNHEFDLSESDLSKRLSESQFQWISSNVFRQTSNAVVPFQSGIASELIPVSRVWEFKDGDGTQLKIGVIGLCLDSNPKDYVYYNNRYIDVARQLTDSLQSVCDYVIALTHLNIADDLELSRQVPGLRLIMGGHDHDHMYHKVADAIVAKADANAKTVYVHKLLYDKKTKKLNIQSDLVPIDDSVPMDSVTQRVVNRWTAIADRSFQELGFEPKEVLLQTKAPLDGRESSIRHHETDLTKLIAQAVSAATQADATVLNSGSIRVDDQLEGNITQYDILRTLPFGGEIWEIEMKGSLLKKILEAGQKNEGSGGYLIYDRIAFDASKIVWLVNQKPLDTKKTYRIAVSDFLMSGKEKNLDFLTVTHPDIRLVRKPENGQDLRRDIRQAIIAYLRGMKK